jgi:ceramide glucosyltransferase
VISGFLELPVFLVALAGAVYQLIAITACVRHLTMEDPEPTQFPSISVLKPVRGLDPQLERAIESHAALDYPDFELLIGVSSVDDPAVPLIRDWIARRPNGPVRLIVCETQMPNRKVGLLADLAREARHAVLVVNDADICVEQSYLKVLAGHLQVARTGLVTSAYRACAREFPARMEALGIATDFAPSTLVAPLVGVNEFGLGSTLALRRETLNKLGGFEAIGSYLADDYQLGKQISDLGLKVRLTRMIVETSVSGSTWGEVWDHQVRWARTIRVSRGGGYAGLFVTNATVWALALMGMGNVAAGLLLLGVRYVMAWISAGPVLHDRQSISLLALVPVRDLFGFAVWVAGLFGNEVRWRDRTIQLRADGRIE